MTENISTILESTKIMTQLVKVSGQEVVDGILSASTDELKAKVVLLAKHEDETESALKEDAVVNNLKSQLKEAQGPYKETLKGNKLQRRFIAMQLAYRSTT